MLEDIYGRPLEAHRIADEMLKKASKTDLWGTVDMIVSVWLKRHPKEAEEHAKFVSIQRGTRKNKFASTQRNNGDLGGVRYVGEIPTEIFTALDLLCYQRIKEYGEKRFYSEFFKRYAIFRVAEKI